jgi:ABC-type glycerol-3-phosphate transport system substrate-binding protein
LNVIFSFLGGVFTMKKNLLLVVIVLLALTQTVAAQEGTTIKVWGFVWTADWLDTLVEGFEAAHPGVTVEVERFEYEVYRDAIITALSSGEGLPDVVTLDPMWAGDLIRDGAMSPLEGIEEQLNHADYVAGGWELCGYGGVQYGVPADLDFNLVFYRTDIYGPAIEAAGLEGFPTNTEDFITVAQAISTDEQKAILLAQQDYYGFYQGFLTPYNARLTNPEGTEYTFNSPEAVAALTLYADLVNTHGVARLWDEAADGSPINALKSGEVAAVMYGSWYATELAASAPEMEGLWSVAPLPFGPADRTYSAGVGGACFSIPAASQNQEVARDFLVYMEQPETMATYFDVVGGVPALSTAWEHIDLTGVNEYLGVPLAGLIAEWSANVRGMELPSAEVADALGQAIYQVTIEGVTPQQALDDAVAASPDLE